MPLRVVLAGGGTAGHVNPLLATAHVLRDRGHAVVVLGTEEGLESDLVPSEGFDLVTIPKVPMPRRPSTQMFSVPGKLREAVTRSAKVIEGADVVVGYGGYVSAPAYIAAKKLGVPVVIHEQNVRAGWANKMGARFAAAVALTFPSTKLRAKNGRTEVTGMPLRKEIMELSRARQTKSGARMARTEAARHFGMNPDLPTLLVTGGSLGALKLNNTVTDVAPDLAPDIQILHVTGKGKVDAVKKASADPAVTVPWFIYEYMTEMDQAMAAADLVVCRSGAGTVCELTAIGMPAVYVPFPIGNGEQALNAEDQVGAGGALLVYDQDFGSTAFSDTVLPLLRSPDRLQAMGEASRSVSPGDGGENLVKMIEMAA
ncbi:MAG: undecaprenyldiphospho-muramoylpentapeptide beta-N-acetylglucosaminyltransferase [Scrofimicrobium sp.]